MNTLESISKQIDRKKLNLSPNIKIVHPDSGISPEFQADWLISLLGCVYTQHGITKKRNTLLKDIQNGNCKVWFATEDEKPVASAALVKQSDSSVEIGRAVSLRNGVGGLLMLMAARDHLSTSIKPLVAEVRIARNYAGVPSGEATQIICLDHIGLFPHAAVTAFNHGVPVRQETFLFSSSQSLENAKPMTLPEEKRALDLLLTTALALPSEKFFPNQTISHEKPFNKHTGWVLAQISPFSVMVPDGSMTSLENAANEAETQSAFTLVPIETVPESVPAIIDCLNFGFVPCGVDRNLGESGRPVLLLGKLRKGTNLAPIRLVNGTLTGNEIRAVNKIDKLARQSLNSR